jgi:hypothetical protein
MVRLSWSAHDYASAAWSAQEVDEGARCADPVAASVDRRLVAAYVQRIHCDGLALTNLARMNRDGGERCR